jgi:hypothetical protein
MTISNYSELREFVVDHYDIVDFNDLAILIEETMNAKIFFHIETLEELLDQMDYYNENFGSLPIDKKPQFLAQRQIKFDVKDFFKVKK